MFGWAFLEIHHRVDQRRRRPSLAGIWLYGRGSLSCRRPFRLEANRLALRTFAAAGCTKRNLRDAAIQFAALAEAPNPSRRWQATPGEETMETEVLFMAEADGAFLQPAIQVGACADSPASAPALEPQRMRRLRVQYSKDLADTGTPIPGIRTQPTQAEMEGPIEDFLERVGDEAALKEVVQLLLKTEDGKGPRNLHLCPCATAAAGSDPSRGVRSRRQRRKHLCPWRLRRRDM